MLDTSHCPEYLAEVRAWADANGCSAELEAQLGYLRDYAEGCVCELHKDFAPHSFEFLMRHPNHEVWFNGGLIYSGPGCPSDGSFPSLTVSIDSLNGRTDIEHKWSVHT